MPMPRTVAGRPATSGPRLSRLVTAAPAVLRRHWLLALLLAAGLVLRILVQIAYRPALFYIDSIKYLFGAYPGNDPPGYQLILKPFLAVANLDMVAAVQHLLGLGMAVALYVLLLRRGVPRWLAALATAPVLLDGYQLQMEQTVMPDVLFEALMVAGLVVLLWQDRPGLRQIVVAGLLFGATATVWQPGEILILPAAVYALIMTAGWRRRLGHAGLICLAFAVPILVASYRDYLAFKHFSLAPYAASTIYGRMAYAADCHTLTLPAYERPLCPSRQLALKLGPDNLDHAASSPLKHFQAPASMERHNVATDFSQRVLVQQPLRVAGSILNDAIKLFEAKRVTSPGDTPISRWQFRQVYPTFNPYVTIHRGQVRFGEYNNAGQLVFPVYWQKFRGGGPRVITPIAKFLRAYQLDGGYTPGPLLLFLLLAGLVGSAFLLRRRKNASPGQRNTARACCFVFVTGVVLLLLSDVFEFSWRYQLTAVITLPPAGVLGITVMIDYVKSHRRPGSTDRRPVTSGAPADGTVLAPGPADGTVPAPGTSDGTVPAPGTSDGTVPAPGAPDRTVPAPGTPDRTVLAPGPADGTVPAADPPIGEPPMVGESTGNLAGESTGNREPQGKNHASAG